jgi:pimeloyl-ACP methyl ester carboxylesterase
MVPSRTSAGPQRVRFKGALGDALIGWTRKPALEARPETRGSALSNRIRPQSGHKQRSNTDAKSPKNDEASADDLWWQLQLFEKAHEVGVLRDDDHSGAPTEAHEDVSITGVAKADITAGEHATRRGERVLLIWGDRDWARLSEREHDRKLIAGAEMTTVERGGHFLALDRPQELTQSIFRFAKHRDRTT